MFLRGHARKQVRRAALLPHGAKPLRTVGAFLRQGEFRAHEKGVISFPSLEGGTAGDIDGNEIAACAGIKSAFDKRAELEDVIAASSAGTCVAKLDLRDQSIISVSSIKRNRLAFFKAEQSLPRSCPALPKCQLCAARPALP